MKPAPFSAGNQRPDAVVLVMATLCPALARAATMRGASPLSGRATCTGPTSLYSSSIGPSPHRNKLHRRAEGFLKDTPNVQCKQLRAVAMCVMADDNNFPEFCQFQRCRIVYSARKRIEVGPP